MVFSDQILFVDSEDNVEQAKESLVFFSFSPSETITSASLLFAEIVIADHKSCQWHCGLAYTKLYTCLDMVW